MSSCLEQWSILNSGEGKVAYAFIFTEVVFHPRLGKSCLIEQRKRLHEVAP